MYTFFLIACVSAVVLSPLVLDLFLSFQEARLEHKSVRSARKKGPQLAWASPRMQ